MSLITNHLKEQIKIQKQQIDELRSTIETLKQILKEYERG